MNAPYVEIVDDPRGRLRRWLLFVTLRATARRMRVDEANVAALRESQARLDARLGGAHARVASTPVREPGVNAQWIAPPDAREDRVLLYLHGGAFMFRYPHTHAALITPWCEALHARALMVDYRLAPEHRFPAAPHDCHAAYRWLLGRGVAPRSIVLAGDSAGGNLVLATLHAIRSAGEPMPACAVLLSPVVDLTLSGATFVTRAERDPVFSLPQLIGIRNHYLAPEQLLDPRASPLFASFRGYPPLLIQVGTEEVLLDDAVRAAARAHAEGVAVELEIWRHMPHVFQAVRTLPQAAAARERIVAFIARHTDAAPQRS
ncbi:MAG: alpha/beta hydrolase [Burkholderiales bacterium]|nr:alpha/beta hydrolase [Burkholderiales bacterium]